MLVLLSMPTYKMASWHQHKQCATITGSIGVSSFPPVLIHTFKQWIQQKDLFSFRFLPEEQWFVQMRKAGSSWKHPDSH